MLTIIGEELSQTLIDDKTSMMQSNMRDSIDVSPRFHNNLNQTDFSNDRSGVISRKLKTSEDG